MKNKEVIIIGAGFSSLSASCYLAKAGYNVTILEKNNHIGGRAQQLHKDGFVFDMGPTFYWMPDVFDKFFNDFGKQTSDYYQITQLDPGYKVYADVMSSMNIAANFKTIVNTFEEKEKGSGDKLKKFIADAEENYNLAIKDLVYQPGENIFEIITPKTALKVGAFFSNIKSQVAKYIKHPELKQILEFPVLFLGAKPETTPGFYNFMNYADLKLGTWHPKKGMHQVAVGMANLAKELGVKIICKENITNINLEKNKVNTVTTTNNEYNCDILLSGADYHFTETLLPRKYRQYSEEYWNKKTFAPSALLFYVGFNKKLANVSHHTLFFDTDFNEHAKSIYNTLTWPEKPLFYASFPSITDDYFAPEGKESGTFLIPIAPGIEDTPAIREKYFNIIIKRLEKITNQNIVDFVSFKESYCINDFKEQFNSYKGNAYGLANTLLQTHILRPKLKSKKISNLYFTGQLTVPGPGVPPAIISGEIVSELIKKN
ncbi:phytoene dehydrogenase [Wenyingzhuangia fucanilytica]|uniref:Phytoene dehydrogenase n=1 Tax=Wenyingzhuangia fucanilytica TaxID=1790137 RepID=A0A1B1Y6Q9_9FLAO|nr:phytoene desaturase family protein [Wenyingzhuangia fucanilytica]ANW96424.1 phytoene dehydrogenase [Wenyingzhuangia fucanilytica]